MTSPSSAICSAGIIGPYSEFLSNKSAPEHAKIGQSLFQLESWNDWEDVFATNTIAPFFITTGFSELLEKGARMRGNDATSTVINVSSIIGSLHLAMDAVGTVASATVRLDTQDYLPFIVQDCVWDHQGCPGPPYRDFSTRVCYPQNTYPSKRYRTWALPVRDRR
jgi:NAD(P)-dependent dehydrogenase (short-subunit alcohol dehydrogenase family)